MTVETIHIKGEGGMVIAHDLPLPEHIADRMTKGYLTRVNEDGSPFVEPVEGGSDLTNGRTPRPAGNASKTEWVGYAVRVGGMKPDDAEAMTRADLIDKFGK